MPDEQIDIRDSKGKHITTYYRTTRDLGPSEPPGPLWKSLLKFLIVVLVLGTIGYIASQQTPPPNQAYTSASANVIDISGTYGILRGTVFNKKTHVVFQTPQEFFTDSGQSSFDGLKFDTHARFPADGRYVNGQRAKHP